MPYRFSVEWSVTVLPVWERFSTPATSVLVQLQIWSPIQVATHQILPALYHWATGNSLPGESPRFHSLYRNWIFHNQGKPGSSDVIKLGWKVINIDKSKTGRRGGCMVQWHWTSLNLLQMWFEFFGGKKIKKNQKNQKNLKKPNFYQIRTKML